MDDDDSVVAPPPTKRNHYVPQFLQKYFVGEDGKIWVYDKAGSEPRAQMPRDTGVEKFLYTVQKDDGQHDDSVERAFAGMEGATKPILDRLVQPRTRIEQAEKQAVAQFMAFMFARVPRTIAVAAELGSVMAKERWRILTSDEARFNDLYARFLKDHPDTDMPPADEMRKSFELFESGALAVEMRRQPALAISLGVTGDFHETLMEMHWSIIDAPRGAAFLSGDSPVTSIAIHEDGTAQFGANFVHQRFEVSFPLSPYVAPYLTKRPRQARYRCGNGLVRELNRRTAYMAERFIYSRFRDKNTTKLVGEAALWTRNRPKVDAQEASQLIRESGLLE